MIDICFTKKDGHYVELVMSGHADSDERGKDLVCAAVSAIAYGLANALNYMVEENDAIFEENELKICIHNPSDESDTILQTAWYQLETVRLSNEEFIKINIAEV